MDLRKIELDDLKAFWKDLRLRVGELAGGRKFVESTQVVLKDEQTTEFFKQLEAHTKRLIADYQVQILEKDEEIEKLKKETDKKAKLKERLEIEKLKKQAEEHLKKMQEKQKARSIVLKLEGDSMPAFYLKDERKYYDLYGFQLVETHDGFLLWHPILWDARKRKKLKLSKPAQEFTEIFRNPVRLVAQMRAGKVDSNYLLDENDEMQLLSRYDDVVTPEGMSVKFEREVQELEEKVDDYKRHASLISINLRESEKKREKQEAVIMELEILYQSEGEKAAAYASAFLKSQQQVAPTIRKANDLALTAHHLTVQGLFSQNMAFLQGYEIDKLQELTARLKAEAPTDVAREEIGRDFEMGHKVWTDAESALQRAHASGEKKAAAPTPQEAGKG